MSKHSSSHTGQMQFDSTSMSCQIHRDRKSNSGCQDLGQQEAVFIMWNCRDEKHSGDGCCAWVCSNANILMPQADKLNCITLCHNFFKK